MNIGQEEIQQNLDCVNNFVGYGNPDAKFWFIGIEEHSSDKTEDIGWEEEKIRMEIYKRNYTGSPYFLTNQDFIELNEKYSNNITYEGIKNLYNKFNKLNKIESNEIGDGNTDLFIANLFPLGRATTNDNYNTFVRQMIFKGNFDEWYQSHWTDREKVLSSFLKQYFFNDSKQQKFLFCLGTSQWYLFEHLFGLLKENEKFCFETKIIQDSNKYYGYTKMEGKDIYCLYHPSSSQFRNTNYRYIDSIE